jgi:uncharacterized protein YlxW (UPF0749 family)
MDLLNSILRHPVDPDYAAVAERTRLGGPPVRRARWAVLLIGLLVGVLVTVSALQTSQRAPALATERAELITRIRATEQQLDGERAEADRLTADITRLRTARLGGDSDAVRQQAEITALEPAVGAAAVTGPGLVVVVDDAAGDEDDDRVLDLDLQMLANGLWESGAEAVAINGHRLTTLTAIRGAGEAITVDYRSLTRPYRVEAIGDPRTLPARFAESSGGTWWHELAQNRGMRFETSGVDGLTLPADPGMVLRYAEPRRS